MALAAFGAELDGGQEQVLEEAQLVPVERVERRDGGGRVVAEVPDELAHVRPILLSMWALSFFL